MEPQQTNPTPVVPQPKPNHKIFYILMFIFIALVGSAVYLFLQGDGQNIGLSTSANIENYEKNIISEIENNWQQIKVETILSTGMKFDSDGSIKDLYSKVQKADSFEGSGPNEGVGDIQFIGNDNVIVKVPFMDAVYFSVFKYEKRKFKLLETKDFGSFLSLKDWQNLIDKYGDSRYEISTYATSVYRKTEPANLLKGINFGVLTKVPENVFVEDYWKMGDSTESWKTYRNDEYGFEFKYPNNFNNFNIVETLVDGSKVLHFCFPTNNTRYPSGSCGGKGKVELFLILSMSKKEWENNQVGGAGVMKYIGERDGVVFGYDLSQDAPDDLSQVYSQVDNILSTFKFIDNADISNWKTYNNKDVGISFRYPNDWVEVQWGLLTIDKDYVPNSQRQAHNFTGFCKIVFHDAFSEDDVIQDLIDNNYLSQKPNMTTEILDNIKGTGFNYKGELYKFFPLKSAKTLSISLTCGEDVKLKGEEVLNKILSTFKFTK